MKTLINGWSDDVQNTWYRDVYCNWCGSLLRIEGDDIQFNGLSFYANCEVCHREMFVPNDIPAKIRKEIKLEK